MAQWGQGYQYPMQTGYNPQQFQQQGFPPGGGIAPQPTGFPGQQPPRPPQFQQPQQTGFPGQGFQQPQQTGFAPQQTGFQQQPTGFQGSGFQQRPIPPVPPMPQQFQQQNASGGSFLGAPSGQGGRFLSPSPAPLTAQSTGFAGAGGMRPLVPQQTGFIDPRLQMMSSTFLPANPSLPYNPAGAPQLQQPGGISLQQSFMQHNQNQRGNVAPKVPWALSKAEKKSYDQIFRAWDRGEGFISGQTALEVFGQSGLDKNDLAKVWSLADADNRGKLNLAEFHVAMALIYRRLNGNEIPDELPEELVPPSHKDLDHSVNFLKDILKNDPRARSPAFESGPVSKLKERSFNSSSAPGAGGRQDATVYKYTDDSPPGGFYQPRSRHVDRSTVHTASESNSPSADLDDMKRQLEKTAKMLDRSAAESASRTAEDEALEREMSDVRYRIKRVQEDLEYVSRGPRSTAKGEDRRRLERELLSLMHERVPELERKMADREAKKKRDEREWERERDRRNDRFGRFDDRDRDTYSSPSSARYDRDDRDRDYRSTYDRDRDERDRDRDYRDRDRDRDFDRDRPYSRNRDKEYERPRSPPTARTPPPPPPAAAPSNNISRPPPPAPAPSASPAANTKSMTPAERKAFIQAEAQRRMQERMAALGVTTPAPSTRLDTSVEDRLAKEKKEAEEKAQAAERDAEERERVRRERLQGEKALKEATSPTTPVSSPPATTPAAAPPAHKPTPPAPKPRAPAPPPPRKAPVVKPSVVARSPIPPPAPVVPPIVAAPPPPPPPTVPTVDPEEEAFRAREAALRKAREERIERLRQMEKEEEEAAKRLENEYQARRQQLQAQAEKARTPVPPPAPVVPVPPAPAPPARAATPTPPPAPAPPVSSPPAASPAAGDKAKTNPFSRMMKEGSSPGVPAPTTSTPNGSTNPFFKSQPPVATPPAPTPSAPPPSKSPGLNSVKTSYHTAPGESEDEWDDIQEKEDDDSSEDELDSSRDTRNKLAQQLFGNILPPSRPQSAAPPAATSAPSEPSTPVAPPPPPPPSAPPTMMAPPGAPPPPPPPAVAAVSGDHNALLGAIQAGARLRKAQTNDRSGAALSGKVLGDTTPPAYINASFTASAPSPPTPVSISLPSPPMLESPPMAGGDSSRSSYRDSVDWYAGLAVEGAASQHSQEHMPSMAEEEEEPAAAAFPAIQVEDTADPLDDVDKSVEYRVRSLYAYEGQRPEDLTFGENLILMAHPSKSGGDWWYGTLVRDGKAGFFPNTYVEKTQFVQAKALYDYTGSNPDELPFQEGDNITIVDRTDPDWWKAEKEGVVFIVPAAYLDTVEG